MNYTVEDIGARRQQTLMERARDDVSFTASDRAGEKITVDEAYVETNVGDLARNADLSRFSGRRRSPDTGSALRAGRS